MLNELAPILKGLTVNYRRKTSVFVGALFIINNTLGFESSPCVSHRIQAFKCCHDFRTIEIRHC